MIREIEEIERDLAIANGHYSIAYNEFIKTPSNKSRDEMLTAMQTIATLTRRLISLNNELNHFIGEFK